MVQRARKLLVTTALEKSWGDDDSILFLGEWCKRYERRHVWGRRRHRTVPFHWNDREKLKRDYGYLKVLHDSLLESLGVSLNELHHVDHSTRYWQLQVDPWLMSFVAVVYDHWECLRVAFEEHGELSTIVSENHPKPLPPLGYVDVQYSMQFSDEWNHGLYRRIIESEYSDICLLKEQTGPWEHATETPTFVSRQSFWRWRLAAAIDRCLGRLGAGSNADFVFLESYFRAFPLIRLNLALGQVPRFFFSEFGFDETSSGAPSSSSASPDRSGLGLNFQTSSPFEAFLLRAIVDYAPTALIESYPALRDWARTLALRPKVIFTANAHWTRVHVKTWLAERVENGAKLVIVEHGGSLPAYRELLDVEEDVAEFKVTWFQPYHAKHVQLPPSKLVRVFKRGAPRRNRRGSTQKHCVFIGFEDARYVYRVQFYPMAAQCLVGLDVFARFHGALDPEVKHAIRIKPQVNFGWNTRQRYTDMLGAAHVLPPMRIESAIESARVVVCSYPETTFAEAMASGLPTVLLYPEHLYERHPVAYPLMDVLRSAKILQSDPTTAAAHLNAIWDDPSWWWNSEEVWQARAEFQRQAIPLDGNWVKHWTSFARGLAG